MSINNKKHIFILSLLYYRALAFYSNSFVFKTVSKKQIPTKTFFPNNNNNNNGKVVISSLFSTETKSTADTSDTTPLPSFENRQQYVDYLSTLSDLPKGFSIGTGSGTFIPVEAPAMGDLPIKATVVYLPDGPTSIWTAIFTKNKFPGAPIKIGRQRISNNAKIQALVINNKVSNVCTTTGVEDSTTVCEAVADALDLSLGAESVLPCSTGVIGWNLPAKELAEDVVPEAIKDMKSDSALDMAEAIMTTDRYPKVRSKTLSSGARIVAVAKGAGMIEPNMATMLCYILTDAAFPPNTPLNPILKSSMDVSFNCISVDSDESTSDTAVLISSSKIPTDVNEFSNALTEVCKSLAGDVVRNGEGTGHVIQVTIQNYNGLFDDIQAKSIGKKIVNSPLFKCAVAGNDPNIGRLASAIGSYIGKLDYDVNVDNLSITLGGYDIFSKGSFVLDADKEITLSNYMEDAQLDEHGDFPSHQKCVEIVVDFGSDVEDEDDKIVVWGSDLTAEYVSVNSDYRS